MSGEPASGPGGVFGHAREFCGAGMEYVRARLHLAGMETKEALVHLGIVAGLCVAGLGLAVFAYLFVWIGLVALLAEAVRIPVGWVILGAGVVHLVGALVAVGWAVGRLKSPMFAATLEEFKKDREWLKAKQN